MYDWVMLMNAAAVNHCTIGKALAWHLSQGKGSLCEWAGEYRMDHEQELRELAIMAGFRCADKSGKKTSKKK
jgi:hypothetical protein